MVCNEQKIAAFLSAACVQLGYCLPPGCQEEIKSKLDLTPEERVVSVLKLEGVEAAVYQLHPHFGQLMAIHNKHVGS